MKDLRFCKIQRALCYAKSDDEYFTCSRHRDPALPLVPKPTELLSFPAEADPSATKVFSFHALLGFIVLVS